MGLSKIKTELSKLSGVDMHNPKYREFFKRHFGGEDKDAKEIIEDSEVVVEEEVLSEEVLDDIQDAIDDKEDEIEDAEERAEEEAEVVAESAEKSAEEIALEKLIGATEESGEEVSAEVEDIVSEVQPESESAPAINLNNQLLETQLELELVRAGVRADRIEIAKRIFLQDMKDGADVEVIREKIAQFPEWITKKGGAQSFGMPLGDKASPLTEEEKALKRMGIDPRD
jgi:hypothetical protein